MKTSRCNTAFALAITLVLMALIVIVIVAYLANTRTDRSTSAIYANRFRAKIIAEDGLAAATKLLYDNTRFGNYVTAMPAPSPTPVPPTPAALYTEIYRPQEPSPIPSPYLADYLRTDNAVGEILVSRALPVTSPAPQVDPRPTPEIIPTPLPANSPFALSTPNPILSGLNSYDFNQIVRIGTNNNARLVQPSPTPAPPPAYGQWVRVRNAVGELVGRYAFFVEDESMKINVNSTGNNLALGGSNMRPPDLPVSPTPTPTATPDSQVQEIDPAGVLPLAGRGTATSNLTGIATAGKRVASNKLLGLITGWTSSANLDDYVHLTTTWSQDDVTTARGWQRMDLNATVASNPPATAIQKVSDWIKDAWTGPIPLASLQSYQMFNDNRLRLQLAANIVDYIDSDSTPTDMGDIVPAGFALPVPVIGLEKAPYLAAVEIIFQASNTTYPGNGSRDIYCHAQDEDPATVL